MAQKFFSTLLLALMVLSCAKIDPESKTPVLKQLEGTSWRSENQDGYVLEFKKERVKVRLGGVLGLAESPVVVKLQDANFVLASLYEDTPNPFFLAVRIVNNTYIKVYIWEYKTDLPLEEAQSLLEAKGRLFKLK